MKVSAPALPFSVVLVGLAAVGVGVYVWHRGGLSNAAKGAGAAVVNAAGAAVNGAVGAVSEAVGLPTPDQTSTDPRVARWIIDNAGAFEASKWVGLPALWAASSLAPGTGQPPPAGTPLAARFVNYASYDETDRLIKRYPAPVRETWSTQEVWDQATHGIGA